MKNCIIPTLSENFNQINQTWTRYSLKCDRKSISKITFVPGLCWPY